MLTLGQHPAFAHLPRLTVATSAVQAAPKPDDANPGGVADGTGTGGAVLLVAAVLLFVALRMIRRAVGPVAAVLRAVAMAGMAMLLVVIALVMVVVSVFLR
jgi:hypothetical protein